MRVPTTAGFDPGFELLPHQEVKFQPVAINTTGYLYAWVSNESENTKVWFDDLTITHRQNIVTQATDYGPWGDVLREQRTNLLDLYRYGYQGQFAEKDEETNWNHFEAREYDPVVGRWITTDPILNDWSPYTGMNNAPTIYIDRDGRCPECPDPEYAGLTTGTEFSFATDGEHGGATYILTDPSLGKDGWVRIGGTLDEVVVTPSFEQKLIGFGAGIFNPLVDVGTTLGSSIFNGYSDAFYRYGKNESTVLAPHLNSLELANDFSFKNNSFLDNSPERQTKLITNTVSVGLTVAGAGVNFNISKNAAVNFGANFGIKTVTKTAVVKTVEKSLEYTHK